MVIGIYMTFVVQATTVIADTVLAEKTGLVVKLSKKPDHFRGKVACFIYWFG